MKNIKVYTTNTCPYCTMVKKFLEDKGLSFEEINVQEDRKAAEKLVETTGEMGVPQTEINGEWVLGFNPDKIIELVN
ncbi:glutaredoxin family protein [Staphylococcus equorum]|uniref:glutaredoxin family protein n=1 Tax=Staphylococcus equorum TaxID=246432 RepID=UPI002981E63F|nr:glutaredoxin family protein [Staphylococcus equorum]MDW5472671.1 glutaredoxin family protein [Staphylococcus equorum]